MKMVIADRCFNVAVNISSHFQVPKKINTATDTFIPQSFILGEGGNTLLRTN